jgi:hypothetical protein
LELQATHIKILEERFIYAVRRRERLLEENPHLTDAELWAVDLDLHIKKVDLEAAVEEQRKQKRLGNNNNM